MSIKELLEEKIVVMWNYYIRKKENLRGAGMIDSLRTFCLWYILKVAVV